jgi:TusA-related sulfurtransferase
MKEVEINGRKIRVASSVDAVGLFCPVPIVRLKIELDKMDTDQVVEVLADDPGFKNDVTSWCNRTQNELLLLTKSEEDVYIAYIEKTKE